MKALFIVIIAASAVYAKLSNIVIVETNSVEVKYNNESNDPLQPKLKPNRKYKPVWEDLDSRPLPEWYDRAKIGIFIHWGVFSVPSFHSEWFWKEWNTQITNNSATHKDIVDFMKRNYPNEFTYQDFAPMFTAEFFEPNRWAKVFNNSGARYVVVTSKHHEGFAMFPSKQSFSWNAKDVGPHRDLIGDIAKAVRKQGLEFGVYHSLYEWYNPLYLEDKAANFTTYKYRDRKLFPDIKQLINDYEPSVLWSDGDWEATCTYWNSTRLLAWLYNDSPVKDHIVVNDRWGKGTPCRHGGFYNCKDRYNPATLQKHKWENAFTLDKKSWGYRRNINLEDVLTINKLLFHVVSTVSCGGNVLINVGPTKEGTIAPIFQERLLEMGKWLDINGEAVYGSSPWLHQNDTLNGNAWYTCTKAEYNTLNPTSVPRESDNVQAIYVIFLKWPETNNLRLKAIWNTLHSGIYKVKMLGEKGQLNWKIMRGIASISLPNQAFVKSKYAWTLKFIHKKHNPPGAVG